MILDPDYARIFTQARIIAWQYGYAACLHGSYTRDLDILLVPWTDEARDNFEQIICLLVSACDDILTGPKVCTGDIKFTDKPHGRKCYSIHFSKFGDRRWVDLGIMPIIKKEEPCSDSSPDASST